MPSPDAPLIDTTVTKSLTRQTVSIVLLAQLLFALVLSGAALQHERTTRLRALDDSLQGRSDSLLGAIQDAEDPADNVAVDPAELKVPRRDAYAVYKQDGALLGTSADAAPALIARTQTGFHSTRLHGHSYRVVQRDALRVIDRAETGGVGLRRPVTIVYAMPDGEVLREIVHAARFYLVAIMLAALMTGLIVSLLLKRALRPISDLAVSAEQLSARSLQFEPSVAVMQVRELRPLANVLTHAIGRLRVAFEKEQRFVGDAAHELKTAVAVVRSSLQVLMMKRRDTAEYEAGLERLLEDNSRVELLVAQMLRLAAVEEGGAAPSAVLPMSACVATALAQMQPVARVRGVELTSALQPDVRVRMSAEDASVLVTNLTMNALQHSAAGSRVHVLLAEVEGVVQLRVQDHGCGIGQQALPHVFDRFFREDLSRSRETGGTGLGLSICKALVETAGGTVAIESEVGVGTTLTVTFSQP